MPRFTNGGIVGKEAVRPTLSSASSGIWSLGSQHIYKVSNVWPALPIIADGLQVHLDAGNLESYSGSGTTWFDISGNNRHATLENSPTWSSSNQGFFTFNGTNQRGINSSSSGVLSNGSRSISSWFKGTTGDQIPLSLGTSGSNNNAFAGVPQTSLTTFNVYGLLSTFDESITITSTNLLDNNWKNVVVTWDGANPGTLRVYANGVLVGSKTRDSGEAYATTAGYHVGHWLGGNRYWPGSISNIAIYNRAITEQEVSHNFNVLRARYGI